MNALLGIAKITSNRKIKKWCAIKRYRQWEAKWAKEKAAIPVAAVDDFELSWELTD